MPLSRITHGERINLGQGVKTSSRQQALKTISQGQSVKPQDLKTSSRQQDVCKFKLSRTLVAGLVSFVGVALYLASNYSEGSEIVIDSKSASSKFLGVVPKTKWDELSEEEKISHNAKILTMVPGWRSSGGFRFKMTKKNMISPDHQLQPLMQFNSKTSAFQESTGGDFLDSEKNLILSRYPDQSSQFIRYTNFEPAEEKSDIIVYAEKHNDDALREIVQYLFDNSQAKQGNFELVYLLEGLCKGDEEGVTIKRTLDGSSQKVSITPNCLDTIDHSKKTLQLEEDIKSLLHDYKLIEKSDSLDLHLAFRKMVAYTQSEMAKLNQLTGKQRDFQSERFGKLFNIVRPLTKSYYSLASAETRMIDWRKNIQSVLKNHAGSSPIYIEMGASHILTQEDRDILLKELMGYKIEIIVPKEFQDWVTYVDNKRN